VRPGLRAIATRELRELDAEFARGTFGHGVSRAALAAVNLDHVWSAIRHVAPLGPAALQAMVSAVLAEREAKTHAADLVWTGPEGKSGWARPTPAVLAELFAAARAHVLLAGYAFDHGADVLAPLHRAMREHAVDAELFLNIDPPARFGADPEGHVRKEVATFFAENWTFGPPHPRLYVAPVTSDRRAHVSLHAKCVVVDRRVSLVGSANFTQRGQERNIEVGVRMESEDLATRIVAQFHAALSAGVFVAVT
jgi:hypothetical protein